MSTARLDRVDTPDGPMLRTGDGRWFTIDEAVLSDCIDDVLDEAQSLHHARAHWSTSARDLVVLVPQSDSHHQVLDTVARVLSRHGLDARVSTRVPECPAPGDVIVIGDDDAASRRDRVCDALLTHVYREGDLWFVDPPAGPAAPFSPTAAQVMSRRLAASSAPAGLDAAWHSVTSLTTPTEELHADDVWRIALRIVDVVRDALSGDHHLGEELWCHDTVAGVASTHPVLAHPEPAPR